MTKVLLFIFMLPVLFSCSKKTEESSNLASLIPSPPASSAQASAPVAKEEPKKYFYPFAQKRDPFIPLIAGTQMGTSATGDVSGKKGAESGDFASLELKGIMRDKKGKMALIASTEGESFTLKSGRIYDKQNQVVRGVSGIIKENSVILISQNRTMKELSLQREGASGSTSGGQSAPAKSESASSPAGGH